MNITPHLAAAMAVAIVNASPAVAQGGAGEGLQAPATAAASTTPTVATPAPTAQAAAADGAACELHVWPTENYIGINSGLLAGFGVVGAVVDQAAHAGKVKTVKELMADYLGPQVQIEELNKIGIADTLKLRGYRVVVEEPTPFREEFKKNPELKAKAKAMNAKIKSKQRLSSSTSKCYAELITTYIFYHKAMMYGSNLFTHWIYREFGDKPVATKVASGQVKNPLEHFPPKAEDKVEEAKQELRDAYAKDFVEYVEKKVMAKPATEVASAR
jgi:hypothetical protein